MNKRLPLAAILCVLSFIALSIFSQRSNASRFTQFNVTEARKPFARATLKSLPQIVKLTAAAAKESRENTLALVSALRQRPEVEYAELNAIVHTQTAPNDAYYSTSGAWGQTFRDLWGLQSINVESAWDTTQGDSVVVTVVDRGLDYNHEDIVGNVWQNAGETGLDGSGNDKSSNGIDDDGNDFIDDWHGWDFVTIDGSPGDSNPMDNHLSLISCHATALRRGTSRSLLQELGHKLKEMPRPCAVVPHVCSYKGSVTN